MEKHIRSPNPLKDNTPKSWIIWKEEFLIFMRLLGYIERSNSFKANLFKNLIGPVGLETISKLSFEHIDDKENLDILLRKLDNYYIPQEKETEKRYKFFNHSMKITETIENYIQNLKEQAKDCKFGELSESLVRDVVILKTNDKVLREKYLQEDDLTCDKIIEIYKNYKIHEMRNQSKNPKTQSKNENKNNKKDNENENKNKASLKERETVSKHCWRCQTKHSLRECPAWNYNCRNCGTSGHFEKCCQNVQGIQGKLPSNAHVNNLNKNKDKNTKVETKFNNFSKQQFK